MLLNPSEWKPNHLNQQSHSDHSLSYARLVAVLARCYWACS